MYSALLRICVTFVLIWIVGGNFADVAKKVNSSHIRKLLEDLRLRFCYHDPNGLPQLEPFLLKDEQPIQIDNEIGSVNGYFRNIKINGISNFITDDVVFHVAGFEFDISITIPKLTLSGEYAARGQFAMIFSVHGEDKFMLELDGVHLRMKGAFVPDNKFMSLKLDTIETSVDTVVSNFQRLADDEEANEFLNNVISQLTPKYFEEHIQPLIRGSLKDSIEKVASDYFKGDTALDLIDIITGETSLFPPLREEQACKVAL